MSDHDLLRDAGPDASFEDQKTRSSTYNPFSIMELPLFWKGAIATREHDTGSERQLTNLKRLLTMTERGESILESPEFAQWLAYDATKAVESYRATKSDLDTVSPA